MDHQVAPSQDLRSPLLSLPAELRTLIWGFVTELGLIQIVSRDLSEIYSFFMEMARRASVPFYMNNGWDLSLEYISDPWTASFIDLLMDKSVDAGQQLKPASRHRPRLRQGSSENARLGILFTCRQIYWEVLHLIYQNNTFAFSDFLTLEDFSGCVRKDCLARVRTIQINDNCISKLMVPSFRSGLFKICPLFKHLRVLHIPQVWLAEDWDEDAEARVAVSGDSKKYAMLKQSTLLWSGNLEDMVGVELLCG